MYWFIGSNGHAAHYAKRFDIDIGKLLRCRALFFKPEDADNRKLPQAKTDCRKALNKKRISYRKRFLEPIRKFIELTLIDHNARLPWL